MKSKELLSKEQVNAVLEFSQALYMGENLGAFSPAMQNQLLRNLNNNPKIPTVDKLQKALANYKNNSKDLQNYTEFMSKWDNIFARTKKSYETILALDLQIVCQNAFTDEDYQSEQYKKDKQAIYKFLDAFDYKAEFRKVITQVMTTEVAYYWFRKIKWGNKGMKGTLQLMPQDYCMLTGYWEKGLLYDFDMSYFLNSGIDISTFDPVFLKYYNNIFKDKDGMYNYNPTNKLSNRNGKYALWTQTSPMDGATCFKLDMSNFDATPFLASFLKPCLRNSEIEQLQYNKDMASAFAILAGEIGLFDNAKSGTKQNQFSIDPKTLGAFMGKVKQGLPNEIKVAATPLENVKFHQYEDKNSDMYSEQLKTSAGMGSGVGRIIYSSDRMSNAEVQYAAEAQYGIMKPLYYQFENFLNLWANKLTKKYKFKFIFEGSSYEFDRKNRFDRLMTLADRGIVLNSSAFASAIGMRPQDFDRSLQEGHSGDMSDKLTSLFNINTMKDGTGGRPRKDDDTLTESGESSRNEL